MSSSNLSEQAGCAGQAVSGSIEIVDPRIEKDFNPALFPKSSAASPSSPQATERDEQIQREFCAVYYQLNRLQVRLTEARSQAGGPTGEGEILRTIEKYLQIRDGLEDRYAAHGVVAEPIAEAGLTRIVRFTFGDCSMLRQQRTQLVSSTALLFFPEPGKPNSNPDHDGEQTPG